MIRIYRVWLFNMKHTEMVRDKDFELKNIELVSRASGNNDDLNKLSERWKKSLEDLLEDTEKDKHWDKKIKKMPFS